MLAAIVAASGGLYVSDLELRAPFSGIALIVAACALVAIGFVGRGVLAVLMGVAGAEAPVIVSELAGDSGSGGVALPRESSCDPGCISFVEGALIVLVLAGGLAAAGWATRSLAARAQRPRQQADQ